MSLSTAFGVIPTQFIRFFSSIFSGFFMFFRECVFFITFDDIP
jgi:hypothetical protein